MRILFALCLLISSPVLASNVSLQGDFKQGGLVFGSAPGATSVTLEGEALDLAPNGDFLIGFARLAPSRMNLEVSFANGVRETKSLQIAKQDYNIQRINGLPKNKVSPNPELVKRIRSDNAQVIKTRKSQRLEQDYLSGFVQPVDGPITGVFGSQRILNGNPRSPHKGLDIAAPIGTPVVAAADGVISLVHRDMYLMGQTMMIDHGFGLQSIYIHLNKIHVEEGMRVQKGQIVADVGTTGRSTGPHLHWGVSLYETALDPALIID